MQNVLGTEGNEIHRHDINAGNSMIVDLSTNVTETMNFGTSKILGSPVA